MFAAVVVVVVAAAVVVVVVVVAAAAATPAVRGMDAAETVAMGEEEEVCMLSG